MKTTVASLNDIPEVFRSEYESRDGKYVLKVDGDLPGYARASELAVSNGKVIEFRDRNVALLKEIATLAGVAEASDLAPLRAKLETLAGMDPVEYKALKASAEELKKRGVTGADDFSAQIRSAVDAAVGPLKSELVQERQARMKAQEAMDQATLRQAVADRFLKVGGKPKAIDYIVNQATQAFKVEAGVVKALPHRFSSNSNTPGDPLTIEEWVASMITDADFAFEPSRGGGAGGSGNGGPGARPGVRQIVNPTPQQLGDPKLLKDLREGKIEIVNQ